MSDAEIIFERRGGLGLITLNRPRALNALTLDMSVALRARLEAWAVDDEVATVVIRGAGDKAFCAGGDIRKLYDEGRAGSDYPARFYREEYLADAAVKHFPKPFVALIDGVAMGGGVGVSIHGRHRIASEATLFAMPETGIGLFPDVGGSYFLPRLGAGLGTWLGLTGARLRAADAIAAGVCDRFIPAARHKALIADLAAAAGPGDVEAALSAHTRDPGPAGLDAQRDAIARHFRHARVEDALASLASDDGDWAREQRANLAKKSPTSLKVAARQLAQGAGADFNACMRMEYRLARRFIAGHDFYEGVRAVIIERDNAPAWRPGRLQEVSDGDVAAYFAPLPEGEELPLG